MKMPIIINITNSITNYPFYFKTVRQKSIELGEEYTTKQYITQIVLFGGFGAGVGYLYFYSIFWAIFYGTAAVLLIP